MESEAPRIIVCATDLSEASRRALDVAIELGARLGATQLHALYVHERAERIDTAQSVIDAEEALEQDLRREVDREIAYVEASRGAAPALEIISSVRHGKAYREILHYALEVNAGLIVVGTHGRTGLGHAVLGSVAERVARHAPCDVMVAKAPKVRAHLSELLGPRQRS